MVGLTRRALLGAAAGATAAPTAGCGRAPVPSPTSPNQAQADGDILNALLDLEYAAVDTYTAMIGALSPARRSLGERLAEQEAAHAGALLAELEILNVAPHRAAARYRRPAWRGETDALHHAVGIENRALAAYIDALPKLAGPDPRTAVGAILTTEAEHLAVVGQLVGLPPLPRAFIWGQS